jgi:hypothetical protein
MFQIIKQSVYWQHVNLLKPFWCYNAENMCLRLKVLKLLNRTGYLLVSRLLHSVTQNCNNIDFFISVRADMLNQFYRATASVV